MSLHGTRELLLKSYTAWAFYALAIVTLLPDAIYLLAEIDTNPAVWSLLQLWVVVLGIIGRVIIQTRQGALHRRLVVGALLLVTICAAVPALAQTTEKQTMRILVPHVIKWEGSHKCADDPTMHCAYLDIVGVPTLCYGETKGVKLGQRATERQCRQMLERRLSNDFRPKLHGYFTKQTKSERLTPERDTAYVSLAYNVGWYGAGKSTATRRLNAGDVAGGCKALTWWNKAGGRIRGGLVNRRTDEYNLCMVGV
ncbi:MAG: lysozyme [Cognatishimia sp.]